MRCPHGVDTSERGCVRCVLAATPELEPVAAAGATLVKYTGAPPDARTWNAAVEFERSRIRAIVLRNHGNDWSANQTLAEIDEP